MLRKRYFGRSIFCGLIIMASFFRTIRSWRANSLPHRPRQALQRALLGQRSRDASTSNDIQLIIPTYQDMQQVGAVMYSVFESFSFRPFVPSVICLDGDLGAGKTAFCQGFVRAATGQWDLPVTSPTYLLSNSYERATGDDSKLEIRHMDLYRLSEASKGLRALDLQHVFQNCVSLIEWPNRLDHDMPNERLDVYITIPELSFENMRKSSNAEDRPRLMLLRPHGEAWMERMQHLLSEGYVDDLLLDDDKE